MSSYTSSFSLSNYYKNSKRQRKKIRDAGKFREGSNSARTAVLNFVFLSFNQRAEILSADMFNLQRTSAVKFYSNII